MGYLRIRGFEKAPQCLTNRLGGTGAVNLGALEELVATCDPA
jgi:hypothetical protein